MVDYVETFKCPNCGITASGRGHLCHPNTEELPFTCEYCSNETDDPRHACSEMIDKIEYVCKKCGRLSAYSSSLCVPVSVSGD